jgi:hypothetical protein
MNTLLRNQISLCQHVFYYITVSVIVNYFAILSSVICIKVCAPKIKVENETSGPNVIKLFTTTINNCFNKVECFSSFLA